MPIKDKSLYPKNWRELSTQVKAAAGWKCEKCGAKHEAIGYRDERRAFQELPEGQVGDELAAGARSQGFKLIKIVLTTAHLDQNPGNNEPENLKALCQWCHLAHDRPYNIAKAIKTKARNERLKKYGNHENQYKLLLQYRLFD